MIRDDLPLEFVRVVERAAIAAARTMGQGDRKYADQVAVEAMRKEMETRRHRRHHRHRRGRARRGAHALHRRAGGPRRRACPVDIAVDPLEGTNLCATGATNAIAVLAAAEKGGLLHAPDIYMDKLVVGPSSKGKVDINAPVADNLKAIAKCLDREVHDLVVIVLDRPRHEKLISDIRKAGRPHPPHRRRRPLGRHHGRGGRAPGSTRSWGRGARPRACSPRPPCAA